MKSCKAKTTSGDPCAAHPGASGFCWAHDPALARKRAEAHRLGGHRTHYQDPSPWPEVDVTNAAGLLLLMAKLLRESWDLETGVARSRTLGYLIQVQKGVLEIGELEQRVAALENALKLRERGGL